MKHNMIIVAFYGTGKTWLMTNKTGYIELERSLFDEESFIKNVENFNKMGFTVMANGNAATFEALKNHYKIGVVPEAGLFEEYMARYKERGNDEIFMEYIKENYETQRQATIDNCDEVYYLKSGEYLEDAIKRI